MWVQGMYHTQHAYTTQHTRTAQHTQHTNNTHTHAMQREQHVYTRNATRTTRIHNTLVIIPSPIPLIYPPFINLFYRRVGSRATKRGGRGPKGKDLLLLLLLK